MRNRRKIAPKAKKLKPKSTVGWETSPMKIRKPLEDISQVPRSIDFFTFLTLGATFRLFFIEITLVIF